jgi:ribosomal protein L37AE/L43A
VTTQYPPPNNRPWTTDELRLLREHAHEGAHVLAVMLGRSVDAVRWAAKVRRISLRRAGERRGILLGQRGPWGDQPGMDPSRAAAIRVDILAGYVDMGELERRARDMAHGTRRPVCPSCGQREQERPSTGLCEVCHNRALAQAHRDDVERRESRRELWQERQRKSRRNRAGADT